ncbi:YciI family protein [Hahella chejuensis]|nr:YciI family protein [Hahella chejuensis]
MVSDGPFLETKEQIGGFFMIEANSLEEAINSLRVIAPH